MKKINSLFTGLTLSLFVLMGIAVEQNISANQPGGDVGCLDVVGCKSAATCGGRGTVSYCTLHCEGGGAITCGQPLELN